MASQIKRERVFGNFKPGAGQKLKAKATKVSASERRDGMSKDHLASIRKCWCVACLPVIKKADHAHHLLSTKDRGMQIRSKDKDTVPLCFRHHEDLHRAGSKNEAKTFAKWGVDDHLQLAIDLYRNTGNVKAMNAVIIAHKVMNAVVMDHKGFNDGGETKS